MGRFDKIIGDSLAVGLRQVIGLALLMLQTLFAAKFLGTDGFGTYAIVSVLSMMAAVGSPGFLGAATRELPHHRSTGDVKKERTVLNHVIGGELAISLLWTIVIACVSLFQDDKQVGIYLILIALSIIPAKIVALYQTMAYTDKNFSLQSKIELLRVAVTSASVMATVWAFHLHAVLLAPLVGYVAAIFCYRTRYRMNFDRHTIRLSEYARLAKIGLPITGLNIVSGSNGLQRWGERWLISSYLGATALGVYAFFGWITLTILSIFGNLIQAYQPHIYDLMSEELSEGQVGHYLINPIWAVCIAALLVIGSSMVFLPDIILAFLPEYAAGLPVMAGLLFATLLSCFFWIPGIVLFSVRINGQAFYLLAWTGAVCVSLGISAAMLYRGYGLTSIVTGYAISQAVVLVASYWYLRNLLFPSVAKLRELLVDMAFPLANTSLAILVVHMSNQWLLPEFSSKLALTTSAFGKVALFSILSLPTLYMLEKRTKIYFNYIRPRLPIFS